MHAAPVGAFRFYTYFFFTEWGQVGVWWMDPYHPSKVPIDQIVHHRDGWLTGLYTRRAPNAGRKIDWSIQSPSHQSISLSTHSWSIQSPFSIYDPLPTSWYRFDRQREEPHEVHRDAETCGCDGSWCMHAMAIHVLTPIFTPPPLDESMHDINNHPTSSFIHSHHHHQGIHNPQKMLHRRRTMMVGADKMKMHHYRYIEGVRIGRFDDDHLPMDGCLLQERLWSCQQQPEEKRFYGKGGWLMVIHPIHQFRISLPFNQWSMIVLFGMWGRL